MVTARCIQRFRNKNGQIYGYRLQDQTGKTIDVSPENLKQAMIDNVLNLTNLELTKDNRIIQVMEKVQN